MADEEAEGPNADQHTGSIGEVQTTDIIGRVQHQIEHQTSELNELLINAGEFKEWEAMQQDLTPSHDFRLPEVALDKVSWKRLRRFCTGCTYDYIPVGSSVRAPKATIQGSTNSIEESVGQLLDGIPVLHFDAADRYFDARVLKVDTALKFLYVLPNVTMNAKTHRVAPLMTLPLTQVRTVFTMDEAMRICEEHWIEDANLKLDTIHVLYVDSEADERPVPHPDEEIPPYEKVVFVIVAPHFPLSSCIDSCKKKMGGGSGAFDLVKTSGRRWIDEVKLQDHDGWDAALDGFFHKRAQEFIIQVVFKKSPDEEDLNQQDSGNWIDRMAQHMSGAAGLAPRRKRAGLDIWLHSRDSELKPEALRKNFTQRYGNVLLPIDMGRVLFVATDLLSLFRWVVRLHPTYFLHRHGSLRAFFRDRDRGWDLPVAINHSFEDATNQVKNLREELQHNVYADTEGEDLFTQASTRAVLKAVEHHLRVEEAYARAMGMAKREQTNYTNLESSPAASPKELTLASSPGGRENTLGSASAVSDLGHQTDDGVSREASGVIPEGTEPEPTEVAGSFPEQPLTEAREAPPPQAMVPRPYPGPESTKRSCETPQGCALQ